MTSQKKEEIITFKVDRDLAEQLRSVPNRSAFIRSAITAAMRSTCPLCRGSGILSPDQHKHWEEFSQSHSMARCDDCRAVHIICEA